MISKKDNKRIGELIEAVLALKNRQEAKRFLRDLMTEKELIEFGNRWKAARMLADGVIYTEIENETRLSSTTVARVSKWLNKGMGGYKLMLKRLNSHHNLSRAGKGLR